MKKSLLTLLLSAACLAPSFQAQADTPPSRLERIGETRILVAGYREMNVPFSYLNNGKPSGFGVELTERVAATLRRQLNAPDIRIRWNAVTLSTRLPMMTTNTVDISCATDTHTRARENEVGFSTTFYIANTGLVAPREMQIKDLKQMQGKRIAVAAGSTVESYLRETGGKDKLDITVTPARSNWVAMQMVEKGQTDAFANSVSLVSSELLRLPDPEKFEVISIGTYREAYACLLPKGDPAFKQLVDGVLVGMMESGEMEVLYNKWFIKPVAPFGKGLNLPLNAATRALYQAPNDQALE